MKSLTKAQLQKLLRRQQKAELAHARRASRGGNEESIGLALNRREAGVLARIADGYPWVINMSLVFPCLRLERDGAIKYDKGRLVLTTLGKDLHRVLKHLGRLPLRSNGYSRAVDDARARLDLSLAGLPDWQQKAIRAARKPKSFWLFSISRPEWIVLQEVASGMRDPRIMAMSRRHVRQLQEKALIAGTPETARLTTYGRLIYRLALKLAKF